MMKRRKRKRDSIDPDSGAVLRFGNLEDAIFVLQQLKITYPEDQDPIRARASLKKSKAINIPSGRAHPGH